MAHGDGSWLRPLLRHYGTSYRHHSHVIRVLILRDDVEENRVPISIDVSTMTEEEIEKIHTTDPISSDILLYPESVRSISSQSTTTTSSSTNNANVVPSNGRQVQRRRQAVFANFPAYQWDPSSA